MQPALSQALNTILGPGGGAIAEMSGIDDTSAGARELRQFAPCNECPAWPNMREEQNMLSSTQPTCLLSCWEQVRAGHKAKPVPSLGVSSSGALPRLVRVLDSSAGGSQITELLQLPRSPRPRSVVPPRPSWLKHGPHPFPASSSRQNFLLSGCSAARSPSGAALQLPHLTWPLPAGSLAPPSDMYRRGRSPPRGYGEPMGRRRSPPPDVRRRLSPPRFLGPPPPGVQPSSSSSSNNGCELPSVSSGRGCDWLRAGGNRQQASG